MIEVKVTLPLRIRKGPGQGFGIIGAVQPSGKVIVMDGVEEGENLKGVNKWYYKFNTKQEKQWYWGGRIRPLVAVVPVEPPPPPPVATAKHNFTSRVAHLNPAWLSTNGKNTTIVIIDTGVSVKNNDFNNALVTETDLTDKTSADKDHGTFIAGIVAGTGGEVRGIASSANILSIRFKDENTELKDQLANLEKALQQVIDLKRSKPALSLIVNISQGFRKAQTDQFPDAKSKIEIRIKALADLKVVVFCAAGENKQLLEENLLFPALLRDTVSVGCITADSSTLNFSPSINIITPAQLYSSYNTAHTVTEDIGSSFSVALISSIAALYCSSKKSIAPKTFLDDIRPFENKIADFNYDIPKYQFSITV